jgi:hypothetical protein
VRNNFNATLKDITGDVLVFQGEKYVPATENMRLKNGARIMAMRNSSAMIYYDNRCKQAVKASSISDVDSAKNSLDCPIVKLTEQSLAQPPAIQAPPAPLPPGPVPVAIPPTPIPPVPPPIPAVNPGLIATIVLPLILLDDDDDDAIRAVSP